MTAFVSMAATSPSAAHAVATATVVRRARPYREGRATFPSPIRRGAAVTTNASPSAPSASGRSTADRPEVYVPRTHCSAKTTAPAENAAIMPNCPMWATDGTHRTRAPYAVSAVATIIANTAVDTDSIDV